MISRTSIAVGLVATGSLVTAAPVTVTGPCDIYAAGNTPCVAAHSTTRALYGAYTGPLYQVIRGSDNNVTDISPLSAGGVADAAAQDSFCSGTTCLIKMIYDQSGSGNHLTQAPRGMFIPGPDVNATDNLASAIGAPVTLNGQKAYGVFMPPGTGYRNDKPNGTAVNDTAEGIYALLDGTHYNNKCCFDYGNAEIHNNDTGASHMEAIYFGSAGGKNAGAGSGPWILADLENGLYSGPGGDQLNLNDPSITTRFVTAVVKGQPGNNWSIRGANATSSSMATYYNGTRPSGYGKMHKEGAIIMGIGGDNSDSGQGTFYEGIMTASLPTDATEDAVQANILAAQYDTTSLVSGPQLTVGSSISFKVTTPGIVNHYLSHNGSTVSIQTVTSSSSAAAQQAATFTVRTGLGFSGCFSFEASDAPGSFIRQAHFPLSVDANNATQLFAEQATFCPQTPFNGQGNAFRSWQFPTRFFRHYLGIAYAASNGGVHDFDTKSSFNNDASFIVTSSFA